MLYDIWIYGEFLIKLTRNIGLVDWDLREVLYKI